MCKTYTLLIKLILNAPVSVRGHPVLKYALGNPFLTNAPYDESEWRSLCDRDEGQRGEVLEVKGPFWTTCASSFL